MLNTLKTMWAWAWFVATGDSEKIFNDGEKNMARIREVNGKYALVNNGQTIQTYSRARDARRGAERRGLELA